MLRLRDHLPEDRSVDAVYAPGHCLTYDKQRLTAMNAACLEAAIRQMREGRAKCLVFSACYSGQVLARELALRRQMAVEGGLSGEAVREISGIVDTRDELAKLAFVLKALGAKSVLLVSDEYHLPRLVRWARLLLPGIRIFHMSVRPRVYEFTWEPSLVKTIRAGVKPLWILWNVLFYLGTPLVLRKHK